MQSVIQQTERRRREWSLGSGGKWPIQRWRTQLLATDTQGHVAASTRKISVPHPEERVSM